MPDSMTGYGAGQGRLRDSAVTVEARTVNHRFLETVIRSPRWINPIENRIRGEVKSRFARGRFEIFIRLEPQANASAFLDPAAAKNFVSALSAVQEELGIPGEIDIAILSNFRDVLRADEPAYEADEVGDAVMPPLGEALDALAKMRRREGEALTQDIRDHLGQAQAAHADIRDRLPEAQAALAARARERIEKFAGDISLDEGRLEQELIYLTERGDISEELARLESHIAQFEDLLAASGAAGRKLDFLLQEMNREANTIASKSVDLPLTQRAVDLKSALEKVREQVQNIE